MKKFETGKTYHANVGPYWRENIGPGRVHIDKRTRCYVTVSGEFTGRFQICEVFGCETILLPSPYTKQHKYFCLADSEEV